MGKEPRYAPSGQRLIEPEEIPQRCRECAHAHYLEALGCLCSEAGEKKAWREDCRHYVNKAMHRARNAGKEPRQVVWKADFDYLGEREIHTPYCPACGEYAYTNENGGCFFCGQPLLLGNDPREKDITVTLEHEGHTYTLTEAGEYRALYFYVDGALAIHSENRKRHDEAELSELLKIYAETHEEGFFEKAAKESQSRFCADCAHYEKGFCQWLGANIPNSYEPCEKFRAKEEGK